LRINLLYRKPRADVEMRAIAAEWCRERNGCYSGWGVSQERPLSKVIALVDDVFFRARIAETALLTGVEFEAVVTGKDLLEKLRGDSNNAQSKDAIPALILLDLNARGGPLEALRDLQAAGNQIPVIAFLSHVQTELAEQARAAGCAEVMPRSKFTQNLAAILERAKAGVGN
jgi:CheY-like chemotaxis protein